MATREKTVTFAFPMTSTLVADAAVTNLNQITVFIPEASPVFTSVFIEDGFQDAITVTGGTIAGYRVGLRLGAAAYTTITSTTAIGNTGENIGGVISPFDFTAHFNANWTGTSMTCDGQVYFDQSTGTTLGIANVTLLLRVSYQYDDTAPTQIKTVALPMESPVTFTDGKGLGGSLLGSSGIPQLTSGGVLPENGVTIRDWFIVVEGNESARTSTADFIVSIKIDAGGTWIDAMAQERGLASDRFCRWIFRPSVPDPTVAHDVYIAAQFNPMLYHPVVTLYVTYEFTLSGTTRTINSLILPVEAGSPLGVNSAASATRITRDVIIADPGTITMTNSAFRINWNTTAGLGAINFRAGAQDYRTYTSAGTVVCGMFSLQQRIDAGSAQGAALTLARGNNTITIDGYGNSFTIDMSNINGYILLNYESDVAPEGIGANSHTVFKAVRDFSAAVGDLVTMTGFSFPIPETDYWLMGAGFCMTIWNTSAANALTLDALYLTGEGPGAGYADIYADAVQTDAELGCSMVWARGRDVFRRCPQDADGARMDIEASRSLRFYSAATLRLGVIAVATYHSMTWDVAGSLTGNDAALPSDVTLHRADTGEVMQEQSLSAGVTSYSFTVYDDTEDYYVTVEQDATHVGRSATGTAS